jgi:hypothetical protein
VLVRFHERDQDCGSLGGAAWRPSGRQRFSCWRLRSQLILPVELLVIDASKLLNPLAFQA